METVFIAVFTVPYPVPAESSQQPPPYSLKLISIVGLSCKLHLGQPSVFINPEFLKFLYAFLISLLRFPGTHLP
jgi:hypothetical protein